MTNKKECPYCHDTGVYYAPNGEDDVNAEICLHGEEVEQPNKWESPLTEWFKKFMESGMTKFIEKYKKQREEKYNSRN